MRIPVALKVALLVVSATGFYTYVGQLVPQKQILPPKEITVPANLTTAEMVKIGEELAQPTGKGTCLTCHTIGKSGPLRFPDLAGIASRAKTRIPGKSDVDYLLQSLYEPNAFIVPGFNPGMPPMNKPPMGLTDDEILCVVAWLQSLGGTPNVTLKTPNPYHRQNVGG